MQQTIHDEYIWNIGRGVPGFVLLWRIVRVNNKPSARHTWIPLSKLTILL